MKKLLSMLLVAAMMCSLSACGSNSAEKAEDVAPLDVLTAVWETYAEDEKFAAMGGDMNNMVENAPGTFDATDKASLDATLGFPEASVGMIDDAASLVHMLNANTFTAGAYHVTETDEIEMLVADLEDNIVNRQWLCGFPETLIIVKVGHSTIVSAFGNGELIDNFKTKLLTVYEDAEVLSEKSLL